MNVLTCTLTYNNSSEEEFLFYFFFPFINNQKEINKNNKTRIRLSSINKL